MRKRAAIVRDIHKVYTKGDSFGALSFGGKMPRSGDLLALQLAVKACGAYNVEGLTLLAALAAAKDIETKVGFVTYEVLKPIYGKSFSAQLVKKLFLRGLFVKIPFPETFSHIKRRVNCYQVSDKGHDCLRLFRDTFNSYQREVKRAKIKGAENF